MLLHFAAENLRSVPAIDRYLQQLLLLTNGTDREMDWTDGQTPDHYTDPAPHTMWTASIIIKHGLSSFLQ